MNRTTRLSTVATLVLSGAGLPAQAAVDFVKDIQPILEFNCVSCHREGNEKAGLRLETRKLATTTGDSGPSIVPGKADKSPFYTSLILPEDDEALMPPKKKGGPLPKEQIALVKTWIEEGAPWPENLMLISRKREVAPMVDETKLVADIQARIVAIIQPPLPMPCRPTRRPSSARMSPSR